MDTHVSSKIQSVSSSTDQFDHSAARTFDAIVIGSGYGGAVSAYRMAEAGLKVAVLETGYEHKAPNIPRGQASEWNPAAGHFGPHTITRIGKAVTAWTGTAIGGTSMVNAAVMIRKDNFENWPGGITRQSLDYYYDRAEAMLGARVYPLQTVQSPYSLTVKSRVMLDAAEKLGVPSLMPPVAITYREPGETFGTLKINAHGAAQQGCRQCGECSLPGCNFQAKNSLDFNYLFGARHKFGATIFAGNKVDKIIPLPDGDYEVRSTDAKTGEERSFFAHVVVVAAGCIGSSELLLRNKHLHKTLPKLSERLGRQYTSNGTFIGFAVRSKTRLDPSGGPEITAGLDFKGPDGMSQGHLIFDGSFRGFSYDTFYITGRLVGMKNWMIKLVSRAFALAEKVKLVQPQTTLPLLVIGRDNAVGRFSLNKEGRLETDLNPQDNASFYAKANEHMRAFTRAIGARFLPFPHWSLQSKIDVPHNLGGVPMGENVLTGVVDDKGRVFGYDNLLVLDSSIVPATMGANPALTIAALAERSMEAVLPQLRQNGKITTELAPRAKDNAPDSVPRSQDMSKDFLAIHDIVTTVALPISQELAGKRVLWIPGILARHMGNHSVDLLKRISEMPLDVVAVPVNTDTATRENMLLIKAHVNELGAGQGILMGHSRGGIMALDTYRQLSDSQKAKIWRIILIQSPINGAPLADFVMSHKLLRKALGLGSRIIFGNSIDDTLRELTTAGRESAQRALPALTAADLDKIFVLRSTIGKGESQSFEILRKINARFGQASDGITPYQLSAIPGTREVTLRGWDHENSVIQKPTFLKRLTGYRASKDFTSSDVIEALLRLI